MSRRWDHPVFLNATSEYDDFLKARNILHNGECEGQEMLENLPLFASSPPTHKLYSDSSVINKLKSCLSTTSIIATHSCDIFSDDYRA